MERVNKKLISTLGICKKAGRLSEGFDPMTQAVKEGKAKLVLTSLDLSPKSEKEAARAARIGGVSYTRIPVTMDEIWKGLGRRSGILAVNDEGLAHSVMREVDMLAATNSAQAGTVAADKEVK